MSTPGQPDLHTPEQKTAYLAALEGALMRGVSSVEYDGNKIFYRSQTEMQKVSDWIRSSLGLTIQNWNPVRPRVRSRRGVVRI